MATRRETIAALLAPLAGLAAGAADARAALAADTSAGSAGASAPPSPRDNFRITGAYDQVIEAPDFAAQDRKDVDAPITLRVRREGRELSIIYVPLGAPVTGYRWARDAGVPDAGCTL